MLKISSICPLRFESIYNDIEIRDDYVQKFYLSDKIYIQLIGGNSELVKLDILDLNDNIIKTIEPVIKAINSNQKLYEFGIDNLSEGCYFADIIEYSILPQHNKSYPFKICDVDELIGTSLLTYSGDNDERTGTIFSLENYNRTFNIRLEMGFKTDGFKFGAEVEQFRTQNWEIRDLFSIPYMKYTLVVGDNFGVPLWVARMLNEIFCLSTVKINGIGYKRSESSVPEYQTIQERNYNANYSMTIEKTSNDYRFALNKGIEMEGIWILEDGLWRPNRVWTLDGKWNTI